MKKNFTYEDRILAEQLFDNELEKVFMNLRIRIKNAPPEVKDEVIRKKEKDTIRRFLHKYL